VTAANESRPGVGAAARLQATSGAKRDLLLDELALTAASGDGDAAATRAWAIRHLALATPAIRQYLLRQADIDIAEQRTMIAVVYRIGSFRGDARFTTWLHRVAANEAKQVVRSLARHHDRSVALWPEEPGEQLVQRISSMVADRAVVQREIGRLPDRLRRALLLREQEDLTYEEIAQRLDVPLGTAKTWVRRGRALLAATLASELGKTPAE